jgi:hypothetical protein
MTPNERLDQLEPLVADALQKIDRLIEGQGKILDLATRADSRAEIAAKGIAELTISSQRQFREIRTGQEDLKASQELILQILREKLL